MKGHFKRMYGYGFMEAIAGGLVICLATCFVVAPLASPAGAACFYLECNSSSSEATPGSPTNKPDSPKALKWVHNGSIVVLKADGAKREFYYLVPRPGVFEAGAKPGSLLFSGSRSGNTYSGIAYIFNKNCGPMQYAVSGTVGDDDRSVILEGQAPRVDDLCHILTPRHDTLVFKLEERE
jgi:hypothetical protein